MSAISVTTVSGLGSAPIYTGLSANGSATAKATVRVYYEVPANGVKSADITTTADDSGAWSVKFNGEFSAGTEVTVVARLSDNTQAEKTETLPTED